MTFTCSVDGCNEIHEARGYCQKHYHRWYRHGDPMIIRPPGKQRPGPVVRHGDFCAWHGRVRNEDGACRFCGDAVRLPESDSQLVS